MQIISILKELIWHFFSETPIDEPTKLYDSLPKSMSERTKDYKIRKFEVHEFSSWGKETHDLIILVSKFDFSSLDPCSNFDPIHMRARILDSFERSAYLIEVPKYIQKGNIEVHAQVIDFGLIEITKCIQEGYHGDSDGFGVEPDTWIVAYLNSKYEFVSPFALEDSSINLNISNLLVAGINPVNEDGTIKICPFDKVEKDFRMPDYFHILQGNDWGFANKNLVVIIPPAYKVILGDQNGMVCFRQHNNLCGLLSIQNELIIPARYDYLGYRDKGKYLDHYEARLDGKTGILSRNNEIVKEFE